MPEPTEAQRALFDTLVDEAVSMLPPIALEVIAEAPVVVLDRPTPKMLEDLGMTDREADELCGLHTGVMRTERSIEHMSIAPGQIHLFRCGIAELVGGWDLIMASDEAREDLLAEISTTLLHEIGHELGLEEDDLDNLGYA